MEAVANQEQRRDTTPFHFKEIAEVEDATTEVVIALKKPIEEGHYPVLVSDDGGGRIPTLVLRRIMRSVRPDVPVKTYFVAGGVTLHNPEPLEEAQLTAHLRAITEAAHGSPILLVTQFMRKGEAMKKLVEISRAVGAKTIGVASLNTTPQAREQIPPTVPLYTSIGFRDHTIDEKHEHLSGVRKHTAYTPFPMTLIQATREQGRLIRAEDLVDVYEFEDTDSESTRMEKIKAKAHLVPIEAEKRKHAPLTPEEEKEMQRTITLARQDIALLAQRVKKRVWPEEKG